MATMSDLQILQDNLDHFFLIITGCLIFCEYSFPSLFLKFEISMHEMIVLHKRIYFLGRVKTVFFAQIREKKWYADLGTHSASGIIILTVYK